MDGWIKLYRQLITNGWLKNHNVCIFWIYCLLKAVHEPTKAIVGFQEVNLEPGQFIFGRKKAAAETGLSERETRTALGSLVTRQNLTIKTTNKFSIVSIVNWNTYQDSKNGNDQQNDQHSTSKRPHTRSVFNKLKTPDEISSEISSLALKFFPFEKELFDRVRKAISSTRKTGKIKDTVILSMLRSWGRYTPVQVEKGIRIYLEKSYHLQGKDERYLLGVIRSQKKSGGSKKTEPEPSEDLQKQTAARMKAIEGTPATPCPDNLRPEFMREDQGL